MQQILVPPSQFAIVNSNLYRGSYPELINLQFLRSLKLKCIVALLPEPVSDVIKQFCKEEGISLFHMDTEEYEIDGIPSKEDKSTVLLINSIYYPLFFFSNNDSKITSVYVMLIRYVQNYCSSYIFKEFKKFGNKIDEDLKSIFDDLKIIQPQYLPDWLNADDINPVLLAKLS